MIQQHFRYHHNLPPPSFISFFLLLLLLLLVVVIGIDVVVASFTTIVPTRLSSVLTTPRIKTIANNNIIRQRYTMSKTNAVSSSSSSSTPYATIATPPTTATTTTSASSNVNNSRRVVLHWFRLNDLRVHDNPALVYSTSLLATSMGNANPNQQDVIIPIFCFDTSTIFGDHCMTTSLAINSNSDNSTNIANNNKKKNSSRFINSNSLKCSPRRAQFIIDSVIDLRRQLQTKCQSQLLVACGHPPTIFNEIIQHVKDQYTNNIRIVCQNEVASEEIQMTQSIRTIIKQHFSLSKEKLIYEIWGSTMYDRNDLPYDRDALFHMPNSFTPFRNEVEQKCKIHKPLPIPKYLPFPHTDWPINLTSISSSSSSTNIPTESSDNGNDTKVTTETTATIASMTYMPTLADLGYTPEQVSQIHDQPHDPRGFSHLFKGGETAGLQRIQQYIWDENRLQHYFDTRNGMIGAEYSTKFSPWLAHGCISPRFIVSECHRYEQERVKNKSTYWVVFELLWRDYCKFFVLKHKRKIFYPNGILQHKNDMERVWNYNDISLQAWKDGMTGYPLVDANMREMKATGFMSNRGRQNVASFLALDLHLDWRYGGDWFESNLIDYDVYSNWVNWCAAAGVAGGRINRFNIVKQSRDYDQHGEYVKLWIPELKDVPISHVHEPWTMTQFQQIEYNCQLGVDYPNPIIPPFAYNASGRPGTGRGDGNTTGGRNNNNNSRNYDNTRNGGGRNNNNNNTRNSQPRREKQRRPYTTTTSTTGTSSAASSGTENRHQKYEMTGLKEGRYNYDDDA